MFVWEMVSCRLRGEGWEVWHTTRHDVQGPTHVVHLHRLGATCEVSGPTLTDAYAAASRRASELRGGGPHFPRSTSPARLASGV